MHWHAGTCRSLVMMGKHWRHIAYLCNERSGAYPAQFPGSVVLRQAGEGGVQRARPWVIPGDLRGEAALPVRDHRSADRELQAFPRGADPGAAARPLHPELHLPQRRFRWRVQWAEGEWDCSMHSLAELWTGTLEVLSPECKPNTLPAVASCSFTGEENRKVF